MRSAGNLDRSLSEPEMGKEIMKFCEKKKSSVNKTEAFLLSLMDSSRVANYTKLPEKNNSQAHTSKYY